MSLQVTMWTSCSGVQCVRLCRGDVSVTENSMFEQFFYTINYLLSELLYRAVFGGNVCHLIIAIIVRHLSPLVSNITAQRSTCYNKSGSEYASMIPNDKLFHYFKGFIVNQSSHVLLSCFPKLHWSTSSRLQLSTCCSLTIYIISHPNKSIGFF